MSRSRKQAAVYSTIVGLVNSVITIILTFVLRTILLKCFSTEYVGLYTVLTQTIGILVGFDAGLSSSIMIRIHKPIAENDIEKIRYTYFLVRVIYYVRSALVLGFGTIIGLIMPRIIVTNIDVGDIYIYYFAYLMLNAVSYLFIFDYFMLETVQKRYIASIAVGITNVVVSILNILSIIYIRSYGLYIVLTALNSIVGYFICSRVFRRMYPTYLYKYKVDASLLLEFKELFGMAIHTLSNTVVKHSETIIISAVVSLVSTGLYSNYHMIITALNTLVVQLTSSVKDPLRNIAVTSSFKKAMEYVKKVVFLYGMVMGIMCITFCATADVFVTVFWGKENVFTSEYTVYLMACSAFLLVIANPIVDYYYCKEMYIIDRYSPIIEIILNIIISLFLGKLCGLDGIIMGTIITYAYRIIHRTSVLCKEEDKNQMKELLVLYVKLLTTVICFSVIFTKLVKLLLNNYTIFSFILSAGIVCCISLLFIWVIYGRTSEFLYYKAYFIDILDNKIRRK